MYDLIYQLCLNYLLRFQKINIFSKTALSNKKSKIPVRKLSEVGRNI